MPVAVVVKPSQTICGAKDDDPMRVTHTGIMDYKVLTSHRSGHGSYDLCSTSGKGGTVIPLHNMFA